MLEEQFSYDTNLIPKKGLKEYRRNGNHWKHNQLLQLQKEHYDKMLDILPTLISYVQLFKETCGENLTISQQIGSFFIVLQEKYQKVAYCHRITKLTNLQNLDVDSLTSHFELFLHKSSNIIFT